MSDVLSARLKRSAIEVLGLWACVVSVTLAAHAQAPAGDRAAARRLAALGRYTEALAVLDPLAAASPADWQLVCETAFVALEAGEVARASHLMSGAIGEMHMSASTAPLEPRAESACQYNAGRVAEAAGHLVAARAAYGEASRARASPAADRRVAGLDARLRAQPTLAALVTEICRQKFDWLDCVTDDITHGRPEDGEPGSDDEAPVAAPVDHGPLEAVALMYVIRRPTSRSDDDDMEPSPLAARNPRCVVVVAHDPSGWALVGRAGPTAGFEIELAVDDRSFAQWIPGGPEELSFDVERTWEEISPSESSDREDVFFHAYDEARIVCALVDDSTRCALVRTTWRGEHAATCSTSFSVGTDGGVTLRRTGGNPHCPRSRTLAFDALLADPSVRLPGLFESR